MQTVALAIALILALTMGMVRNTQAYAAFDCDGAGSIQELSLADNCDDGEGGDGGTCILTLADPVGFMPPDDLGDESCASFFPSLSQPPAIPPPISA